MSSRQRVQLHRWNQGKPGDPSNLKKQTKANLPTQKKKKSTNVDVMKSVGERVERIENKSYGKPATTMTGLPWSVRLNPAGMKFPEKRIPPKMKPRMGTYTFTYGLTDNENDPPQPIIKPHPQELDFPDQVKHFLDIKSGTNNSLAKSGYTPSMDALMKQTGNTLSPTESAREILELEALWDDIKDNSSVKQSDSVSPSELEEAKKAFDFHGLEKLQNLQPSKLPLIPSIGPIKTEKKVKLRVPTADIFKQSYRLLPHIQEKLIEDQVKKEFAYRKIAPIGSDYIKRKQELMRAAFKAGAGYNENTSDNIFPDLVDEYNFNDLFKNHDFETQDYEVLKRPGYTISQENPQRHIQTLSPPMLDPKDVRLRQRHNESIIGTVLREMKDSKNSMRQLNEENETTELPQRKRTKDQERNRSMALRALENYRLIQERQKAIIHHVPQITVRRHGPEVIPMGSEYHQLALSHTHRSHGTHHKTTSKFKPIVTNHLFDSKKSYTTINRKNQYPTHNTSQGLPPPPPPVSDTIFPIHSKQWFKGNNGLKKGKVGKTVKYKGESRGGSNSE